MVIRRKLAYLANCKTCLYWTVISILLCSGCQTRYFIDAYPHQPWIEQRRVAKGRIAEHSWIDGPMTMWLEWQGAMNYIVDSREITKKCERFLQQEGFWEKPKPITPFIDYRYPWGMQSSELSYHRKYNVGVPQKFGYDNTKTIVCLNPTVVIAVQGTMEYWPVWYGIWQKTGEDDFELNQFVFPPSGKVQYTKGSKRYIILRRGFAYGTRMPYDPAPQWFSPDMDITPRPVDIGENGVGRIEVPWGYLVLTEENDEWIVTTEKK